MAPGHVLFWDGAEWPNSREKTIAWGAPKKMGGRGGRPVDHATRGRNQDGSASDAAGPRVEKLPKCFTKWLIRQLYSNATGRSAGAHGAAYAKLDRKREGSDNAVL
jgi:hypothetical protein